MCRDVHSETARGNVVIDRVVGHLAKHLNSYYQRRFQVAEDVAVVSNLQEVGGAPVALSTNKIVLFLTCIIHDMNSRAANRAHVSPLRRNCTSRDGY